MSIFSSIKVGVKTKRYTHHLPFDNNTTMSFGVIQPLFCQYLSANDKISVDVRQLVRLAPLPVPTFGRMRLENRIKFVKATDVYPAYEAFLSNSTINSTHSSYKPTRLPSVTIQFLTLILLHFSVFSVYKRQTDGNYKLTSLPSDVSSLMSFLSSYASSYSYIFNRFKSTMSLIDITPDGADYILFNNDESYMFCFRFTNAARRFRTILIGLGYTFDLDNKQDKLSILPLFAFYKAYYDTYAPSRDSNWLQTSAFKLISFIYDYNILDFSSLFNSAGSVTTNIVNAAWQFFDDLVNCWYVEPLNYVSAHRDQQDIISNGAAWAYNPDQLNQSGEITSMVDSDSSLPYAAGSVMSINVRQMMKLTRFFTKDSIIGKKVSDWLKIHFGADVSNDMFADSSNIASSVVNCSVNDVFSTSDTMDSEGNGETLGAYAGKGLGFDNTGYSYTAPTFGFVIHLATIVPDASFFQGYDPTLYAIAPSQLPSAELDALGYESTPLASIMPCNDITNPQQASSYGSKGFGLVPRFSSFKTKKDIINGDMSRRGVMSSYAPYYLDKVLTSSLVHSLLVSKNVYEIMPKHESLPTAGETWRFTTKFPWLGNYNRIFTSGNVIDDYKLPSSSTTYYNEQIIDDLFLVQSVFDMRLNNNLKPMSESYDTFDDDVNGDNSSISKEAN